jgi:hypothetical protein
MFYQQMTRISLFQCFNTTLSHDGQSQLRTMADGWKRFLSSRKGAKWRKEWDFDIRSIADRRNSCTLAGENTYLFTCHVSEIGLLLGVFMGMNHWDG